VDLKLRELLVTVLVLIAARPVAAQSKISPRIANSGGTAYVVVFRPDADMSHARGLLVGGGFDVIEHPDLRPNHLLAAGPRGRLPQLDALDEVAYILPASADLVARHRVIACAGAILENGAAGQYVEVGRGWPKDANGAVALRYFFDSLTAKVADSVARGEIERAFREWQKYGDITLTAGDTADGPRTITVRFSHGAHGDPYPFDGPGGMLAHTFYPAPPNSEPIAGDMHFDADEDWEVGTGIDLFTVALHEAGHALGLGHSDQPGAVMYPYYRQAFGLTSDDIAGIQDLYGVAGTAQQPAPAPVTPPTVPPAIPPPTPPTLPVTPPVAPPPATPPQAAPSSDRTPPTLRITAPASTVVATSSAALPVSGTAVDDTAVAAVKWSTSTGDSGEASGTSSWSASVPLYVGTTVVTVRAYDAAGNVSWRAITVTRR
jgi:hypothetical protein